MDESRRPVLVTGATGYIGGRLIPELLEAGIPVRALARTPAKLEGRSFVDHPLLEVVRGDVLEAETLVPALEGARAAYYFVHSMAEGAGFAASDQRAARTFGQACADVGVERIVYLSALGRSEDDLSEHLRSRQHTGELLGAAGVPVTELRAAIVVGSGSASFEIIYDIARKLPVTITPRWVKSRCEPIAIRDMTWYLARVLDEPRTIGETLEIGSGEQLTYEHLLTICAEELGRRMRNVTVPVLSPRMSSWWLHLVTSVDRHVARPLVEGLRNDVVCTDTRIREWMPRDLSPYRLAVKRALAKRLQPGMRESRWTDAQRRLLPVSPRQADAALEQIGQRLRLFPRRTAFRDYRTFDTDLGIDDLYARVAQIGGARGYGRRADLLWKLRGALDRVTGGPGLRRGRPFGEHVHAGDPIDFWRVERAIPGRQLRLVAEMRVPGVARLDFRVERLPGGGSRLHQLASLSNESVWSGLYWVSIAPLHDWVFGELGSHVIGSHVTGPAEQSIPAHTAS